LTPMYKLTRLAEADLREIARYTRKQWGQAQVGTYRTKLMQSMDALASGSGRFKELPELRPGLRMTRCQHHCIFMLLRPGEPAVVLAVLHERMDLMDRLQARLVV
jgi:toxin ParE1/3/4